MNRTEARAALRGKTSGDFPIDSPSYRKLLKVAGYKKALRREIGMLSYLKRRWPKMHITLFDGPWEQVSPAEVIYPQELELPVHRLPIQPAQ